VREDLGRDVLRRVLPAWNSPQGIVHVVFPTRRGLLPAVRAFIDFLRSACRAPCEDSLQRFVPRGPSVTSRPPNSATVRLARSSEHNSTHFVRHRRSWHRAPLPRRGGARRHRASAGAHVIAAMPRGSPRLIEVAHSQRGVLQSEGSIIVIAVAQQDVSRRAPNRRRSPPAFTTPAWQPAAAGPRSRSRSRSLSRSSEVERQRARAHHPRLRSRRWTRELEVSQAPGS